jgi:hypothetical protein
MTHGWFVAGMSICLARTSELLEELFGLPPDLILATLAIGVPNQKFDPGLLSRPEFRAALANSFELLARLRRFLFG